MNSDTPVYTADEFERESRYIEQLIWDAIAVAPASRVLICGYGPDGAQVKRALAAGAVVTVIEHRSEQINRFADLGATALRGSTSVIPARENTFDLAIAFHYLHEIDPFFHAQVLFELARVSKRIALVEPAPPSDPLGKQIALLYSQAKRELGAFEYYQPLEYWKKLLHAVKADISQHVFAFAKVPPREYLLDTIDLLLDTIEVEELPREYIDDLRAIAKRSDAQLLPPPRYVLIGAAVGDLVEPRFSHREEPPALKPSTSPTPIAATTRAATPIVSPETGYEFPPIDPPSPPRRAPEPSPPPSPFRAPNAPKDEPPPVFSPGLLPGAPMPPNPESAASPTPDSPFSAPFAMPPSDGAPRFGVPTTDVPPITPWEWEPPEEPPV